MQEWQSFINFVVIAGVSGVGWFANTLYGHYKELRQAHESHRVEVAKDYVPRASLREEIRDIKDALKRIEDKMDGKLG